LTDDSAMLEKPFPAAAAPTLMAKIDVRFALFNN